METPPVNIKSSPVDSLSKSSLTPCRRIGLCRPSSGSIKKSFHLRTLNSFMTSESSVEKIVKKVPTSNEENECLDDGDRLNSPLKSSDVLIKTANSKVRRCISTGLKTPTVSKMKVLTFNTNCDGSKSLKSNLEESFVCEKKCKLDYSFNCKNNEESTCIHSGNGETSCNPIEIKNNSLVDDEVEDKTEISCDMIQQLMLSIKDKKRKLELIKVQEMYAKKHNLDELRAQTTKWRSAGQEALRHALSLARHAGYSVSMTELMSQHGFPPHLMNYNVEDDEFN